MCGCEGKSHVKTLPALSALLWDSPSCFQVRGFRQIALPGILCLPGQYLSFEGRGRQMACPTQETLPQEPEKAGWRRPAATCGFHWRPQIGCLQLGPHLVPGWRIALLPPCGFTDLILLEPSTGLVRSPEVKPYRVGGGPFVPEHDESGEVSCGDVPAHVQLEFPSRENFP